RVAGIQTTGPDRFAQAEDWWSTLRTSAEVEDEVRLPGTGLLAFGSFAFSDDSVDASVLTVPRVLIGRRDGLAWITHVVRGEEPWPETHPAEILSRTNPALGELDRKSTRLNSSHVSISYAVFCLKKKKKIECRSIIVSI